MQSSYASIEIGHRDSRERSTPVTANSSAYLPTSLVQNILGCQAQALEAISDQAKANKVIQQENSALRQRIEHLENQLWSLKKKHSLRDIDNGDDSISEAMDVDMKKTEVMEIEKENRENPPALVDTCANEQSSSSARNNDVSQAIQELEKKHQKELEKSNKAWSEKHFELQKKYNQQSKDFQDLKDHYKKRSSEWKRAKQWIQDAKAEIRILRAQKGKSNDATVSNAESRARFDRHQDSPSATFANDPKAKSSGTLADVTNVQNRISHSHTNNFSVISIETSSTHASDNKKDGDNQSDILSSNLSFNSLIIEKSRPDHLHIQDSTELWNNNQKVSDSISNKVLSCENSSNNMTDKNNLDNNNVEIISRQKDIDFGPPDGTNAENPIDIDDYDDDNLFLSDDDDQSPSKKRSADIAIKQEQDDTNILLPLNKRWKNVSSERALDNNIVNTPHKEYDVNNQLVVSERIRSDAEEGPTLLTPITPLHIKNKNAPRRSTVSPNLSDTSIRFNEVVRKQSERRQLQGEDCRDCRRFYEITGPMPIPDTFGLNRGHGHTNQEEQSAEALMEARLQLTSRHRSRYSRAPTPPGFWRVGFPTSQELAETNELSLQYEKSREDQKRKDDEFFKSREHRWDKI
ncbi:ctip-related endonuclease [Gigaspora margarita]|uniref:Ctip-related endonuclease n=1 Tax=Gigaspora margarita TaxID=4874 RepID=A0A8H4ELX0_GIGMA|nr:ctip-related endonuclease [Gigaspora margarita]